MITPGKVEVARVLNQIATCLELEAENPFRVRAFRTAASVIEGLPVEPADALADGSLAGTRGIGPATLAIIKQVVETGRSEVLDELRQKVPPGLIEMLGVSGLGVTRIRTIREKLGIVTLAELEDAARDGRLAQLSGFGAKTAEKVLKGIRYRKTSGGFRLYFHAVQEAEAVRVALAGLPQVERVIVAGDVRRSAEVVRDLDLVVVSEHPAEEVFHAIAQHSGTGEEEGPDERRLTLRSPGGMPTRIIATPAANLGAVLVQATGTARHLELLAAHAEGRGARLTGAALWKDNAFVPTPSEAAFYAALGLAEIPPELREGADEVSLAASDALPRLVEQADLSGFLHCHSTWSDGSMGIEELALACRDAGFAWVGLTDHSKSAAYAGGLSAEDVRRQWAEIDQVNQRLTGVRVLKGIEADILGDGALDYDDETLAGFDFVIGSIHSRFGLDQAQMTERLARAIESPYLTVMGHPTGRLLLGREPFAFDLDRIFGLAAEKGVAFEINGDPHRLDLDWRLVRRAHALGVSIAIGSDAHDRAGIANMGLALGMARKGGLTRSDVLNSLSAEEFFIFARKRRP